MKKQRFRKKQIVYLVLAGVVATLLCRPFASMLSSDPLKAALENGDGQAIQQLLQNGMDPKSEVCTAYDTPNWTTYFPFSLAPYDALPKTCSRTSPLIVETVRNVRGEAGQKAVEKLLQCGVDINTQSNPYGTPLFAAVSAQDYDMTRFLIVHGAKLDSALDFDPGSPLQYASPALLRLLIERGLPIHGKEARYNALFWACSTGNGEIVRFLLERGENPNQTFFNGATPLQCAQMNQRKTVIELLLKRGARNAPYKAQRATNGATMPSLGGSLAFPP